MSLLSRIARRTTSTMAAASPPTKTVPIPPRGVDYRGKVVLAPMVRSGELPTRLLALHYGADLVWGPETVDYSMLGTTRRVNPATNTIEWTRVPSFGQKIPPAEAKESIIFKLHPELEGRRLIFQLGSGDPARAVEAARLVAGDVAGIDLNAGCPKPFSTTGGMGAALLRDPDRLCAILKALVRDVAPAAQIGISVKIRLLETPAETEALVRRLVATGITGLTVHCRTTPMRPREPAIRGQLRMVADVCRAAGVACLMNGDVEDRDQGLSLAAEHGADGAMIATTAERNPSCFRAAADGGPAPWDEVVARFVAVCLDTHNRFGNTKFLLNNMVPGKRPEFRVMQGAKTYEALCEALGLADLAQRARDVDACLDLEPPKPKNEPPVGKGKDKRKRTGNPAALASGGSMAQARDAAAKPRKPLSERGVDAARPQAEPRASSPNPEPTALST
ncbi:tRNA dihydrouridine synthase [Gaeumannomyces tritici R3-111a-1]|uniref:tRNA dihydrouridine synthase n=1 Tax=Gaeumannomyces tritici (strain R3-111a-1) TaxID=644352 RepID=J3PKK3_GAET3|nr:tRNA dihydrouridine synthase [Gaeumannomyces tritici R3-111a-1]EJT68358.1 tRNA dihydrouridine synthase [Gaeumannomyces tritici R3-111a-1]